MDRFFLLDTVRHISRYLQFQKLKSRAIPDPTFNYRYNLFERFYLHCFFFEQSESSQSVAPSPSLSISSEQVFSGPSFTIVRGATPILVVLVVPQCISQSRIHIGLNQLYTEPYQLHSGISQHHTDTSWLNTD